MNNETQTSSDVINTTSEIKTNVLTFLTFALYMGYISEFVDALETWIDGKAPEPYVQAFLRVEAEDILAHMKKELKPEELHKWWDDFYPLVLEPVDKVISKMQVKPALAL